MSEQEAESRVVGWYPDGSGVERWWDGENWTKHSRRLGKVANATRSSEEKAADIARKQEARRQELDRAAETIRTSIAAAAELKARKVTEERARKKASAAAKSVVRDEARAVAKTARDEERARSRAAAEATRAALDKRLGVQIYRDVILGQNLYIFANEVWKGYPDRPGSMGGSREGAVAEVIVSGTTTQRVTLTRMALLGPLAAAAPKQTGNSTLILRVQGRGFAFSHVASGTPDRSKISFFETLANIINSGSGKATPAVSSSTPAASPQRVSPADEIEKYASLLARGIITQGEFDTKKKQLLGL